MAGAARGAALCTVGGCGASGLRLCAVARWGRAADAAACRIAAALGRLSVGGRAGCVGAIGSAAAVDCPGAVRRRGAAAVRTSAAARCGFVFRAAAGACVAAVRRQTASQTVVGGCIAVCAGAALRGRQFAAGGVLTIGEQLIPQALAVVEAAVVEGQIPAAEQAGAGQGMSGVGNKPRQLCARVHQQSAGGIIHAHHVVAVAGQQDCARIAHVVGGVQDIAILDGGQGHSGEVGGHRTGVLAQHTEVAQLLAEGFLGAEQDTVEHGVLGGGDGVGLVTHHKHAVGDDLGTLVQGEVVVDLHRAVTPEGLCRGALGQTARPDALVGGGPAVQLVDLAVLIKRVALPQVDGVAHALHLALLLHLRLGVGGIHGGVAGLSIVDGTVPVDVVPVVAVGHHPAAQGGSVIADTVHGQRVGLVIEIQGDHAIGV